MLLNLAGDAGCCRCRPLRRGGLRQAHEGPGVILIEQFTGGVLRARYNGSLQGDVPLVAGLGGWDSWVMERSARARARCPSRDRPQRYSVP